MRGGLRKQIELKHHLMFVSMVSVFSRVRTLKIVLWSSSLILAATAAAVPDVLDIPYIRQTGAGCGWASVAMVMQYWVKNQPGLDSLAATVDRI